MVDIHSHILPSIDDGAKNMEMTINMIKRSVREGTKHIIATPHYRRGFFYTPYGEVKEMVSNLSNTVKSEGIDCNIHFGQEVYYSDKILEDLDDGLIGTINEGEYMLVEFPMKRIPEEAVDYMYELKLRGITPIIAHPERYVDVIKDITFLNNFIKEGCLFQMNRGSILGEFGRDVKKTSIKLVDNYIYSFIGSDAHNDKSRRTGITDGISAIGDINEDLMDDILENSRRLIDGKHIRFSGATIKKKKKLFGIF